MTPKNESPKGPPQGRTSPARIRQSETVELQDVERVKPFIERSLADIGIAPTDNSAIGSVSSDVDVSDVGV